MNLIRRQTSYFSQAICDQTSGHTKYHKVPNERYGQDLSTDTPYTYGDQVVWIIQPLKVKCFFKMFQIAGNGPILPGSYFTLILETDKTSIQRQMEKIACNKN